MKLNDFRPLFDKIEDGKILIGIYDGYMIFAFYRSLEDHKIYRYMYNTIFCSVSVDKEEARWMMNNEWTIPFEDVKTDIVSYDMFLAWKRRNIILDFKKAYVRSEGTNNFFTIQNELKEDGGKIVKFGSDKYMGLLIGAVSTDEDYYYVYVDADYKLHFESCVGGYQVVEDKGIPRSVKKIKNLSEENCRHIRNILEIRLLKNAEVFFTPIYLPLTPDDLTSFKQFSFIYLEDK